MPLPASRSAPPNGDVKIQGKNVTIEAGNNLTLNSGKFIKERFFTTEYGAPTGSNFLLAATAAIEKKIASTVGGFLDLSILRHATEVLARPVEGKLTVKSNRYLALEAGKGKTAYPVDAFDKPYNSKISQWYKDKITRKRNDNLSQALERIESSFFMSRALANTYISDFASHYTQAKTASKGLEDTITGMTDFANSQEPCNKATDIINTLWTNPDSDVNATIGFKNLLTKDANSLTDADLRVIFRTYRAPKNDNAKQKAINNAVAKITKDKNTIISSVTTLANSIKAMRALTIRSLVENNLQEMDADAKAVIQDIVPPKNFAVNDTTTFKKFLAPTGNNVIQDAQKKLARKMYVALVDFFKIPREKVGAVNGIGGAVPAAPDPYDDNIIVISAPEIVIGNVDKSGMLKGGGKVIIRGNAINVEGAGMGGTITQRAPVITQTAVDPGSDGMEEVVYPHSSIVSQARAITLESNDAKDVFSWTPATLGESGIRIHADKNLDVEASMAGDSHKESVESRINALKERKDLLKKTSDGQKKEIDKFFSELKKLMDKEEELNGNSLLTRVNMVEVEKISGQVQALTPSLYKVTQDFIHTVSALAEVNRQMTALEAEKKNIKTGDDFRKQPSGASLKLKGESIDILNHDGDGRFCTNDAASVTIQTPQMGISMMQEDGTLVEGSSLTVNTEHINLSTGSPKKDGSEITASGDITISSKNVSVETVDYELEGGKPKTKALAQGSKMELLAENMTIGMETKDFKSKKIEATSEEIALGADKTFEAQQGEKKASVKLADGKMNLESSGNEVKGKTEFKDAVTGTDLTMNKVEVKQSFKSMNIKDGM